MSEPRPPFIVVGVTASIAAYKAADLVSKLVKHGCDVHVVMTDHACDFIAPLTFQTLSRNPVVTGAADAQRDWKPGHIDLADRADLLLIAPATANVIAELAHGFELGTAPDGRPWTVAVDKLTPKKPGFIANEVRFLNQRAKVIATRSKSARASRARSR